MKGSKRKLPPGLLGVPNLEAWPKAGTERELPPQPPRRMETPRIMSPLVGAPQGVQKLVVMLGVGVRLAESLEEFRALSAAELLPGEAIERMPIGV